MTWSDDSIPTPTMSTAATRCGAATTTQPTCTATGRRSTASGSGASCASGTTDQPIAPVHHACLGQIKQRIDRSTQKKRIRLPYGEALRLCDGRVEVDHEPVDARVVGEVLSLAHERDLRPVCLVGYEREALLGRDADLGLRITFDRRLRGRDRDLDLGIDALNRHLIRPDLMVIEVKVDERVPYWLTNRLAAHSLRLVRLSKYCQGVEAFGQAPRSVFHIPESDDPVPDRASDRQEGKT